MSIKVNNVSYLYNKKENLDKAALKEISLTIKDKDFVTIVGKTGSGKSTLVQTFNALILPTFGYNEIEEFYITEDKKLKKELLKNKDKTIRKENKRYSKLKKKVRMVFQFAEYQLFSETVLKDVMFGPKNFGFSEEEAKERAIKALKDKIINFLFCNFIPPICRKILKTEDQNRIFPSFLCRILRFQTYSYYMI